MMNPVHARCDDDHIQNPFDFDWQPPVRMMKECRGLQCDEEHHQHHGGDAEDRYCKREKSDGKKHFAKMKSRDSAYVQIKIGVMHIMKPPEKRDHVVGPMPPPVSIIHQQKCRNGSGPC